MKKKTTRSAVRTSKTLKISRDWLRKLSNEELEVVAGGSNSHQSGCTTQC